MLSNLWSSTQMSMRMIRQKQQQQQQQQQLRDEPQMIEMENIRRTQSQRDEHEKPARQTLDDIRLHYPTIPYDLHKHGANVKPRYSQTILTIKTNH